jgi:hypothetical protein
MASATLTTILFWVIYDGTKEKKPAIMDKDILIFSSLYKTYKILKWCEDEDYTCDKKSCNDCHYIMEENINKMLKEDDYWSYLPPILLK